MVTTLGLVIARHLGYAMQTILCLQRNLTHMNVRDIGHSSERFELPGLNGIGVQWLLTMESSSQEFSRIGRLESLPHDGERPFIRKLLSRPAMGETNLGPETAWRIAREG